MSDALFQGAITQERFGTKDAVVRLYRNPTKDEAYAPRVTYWRNMVRDHESYSIGSAEELPDDVGETGLFKIEFSVPKMLHDRELLTKNLTSEQIEAALDQVNLYLTGFADLPDVREWRLQRVDYAWMWDVGDLLTAYMSVLHKLRISSWSRHPFDAAEGVVWKSRSTKGRWVKFYNKTKELGIDGAQVLRFEVSNYKDACKYMAEGWFGSDRVVREYLHPGRALYTMAAQWDRLGLGRSDHIGHDEYRQQRLLDVFGKRWMQAQAHIQLIRDYGTASFRDLGLTSEWSYHKYKRELIEHGFLLTTEDDILESKVALQPLYLFDEEHYDDIYSESWQSYDLGESPSQKNFWENELRPGLGLTGGRMSKYLIERASTYVETRSDLAERPGGVGSLPTKTPPRIDGRNGSSGDQSYRDVDGHDARGGSGH